MNLTYVTRVALPSRAAQAGQIDAMARAFHRVLGGRFSLVSAAGEDARSLAREYAWQCFPPVRPAFARQIQFSLAALRRSRQEIIFTRDVAIAAAVVAGGGRAVFEAHKAPAGAAAALLTRLLAVSPRARVVAISGALADHYVEQLGFPRERVLAAHDGVFPESCPDAPSPHERRELRAALGIDPEAFVVVHTGSLYKGGAELFEHVVRVPIARLAFVQVGGTSEECAFWSARHTAAGVGASMRFVSHVPPDVARRYQRAADVLLYVNTRASPIHWCTSPLKLFEYMATGVPILAAAIGSVCEIVDERNAWCFDPDVPASIGKQLAALHADPVEAQRRATLARSIVLDRYSWYTRAERIAEFARGAAG